MTAINDIVELAGSMSALDRIQALNLAIADYRGPLSALYEHTISSPPPVGKPTTESAGATPEAQPFPVDIFSIIARMQQSVDELREQVISVPEVYVRYALPAVPAPEAAAATRLPPVETAMPAGTRETQPSPAETENVALIVERLQQQIVELKMRAASVPRPVEKSLPAEATAAPERLPVREDMPADIASLIRRLEKSLAELKPETVRIAVNDRELPAATEKATTGERADAIEPGPLTAPVIPPVNVFYVLEEALQSVNALRERTSGMPELNRPVVITPVEAPALPAAPVAPAAPATQDIPTVQVAPTAPARAPEKPEPSRETLVAGEKMPATGIRPASRATDNVALRDSVPDKITSQADGQAINFITLIEGIRQSLDSLRDQMANVPDVSAGYVPVDVVLPAGGNERVKVNLSDIPESAPREPENIAADGQDIRVKPRPVRDGQTTVARKPLRSKTPEYIHEPEAHIDRETGKKPSGEIAIERGVKPEAVAVPAVEKMEQNVLLSSIVVNQLRNSYVNVTQELVNVESAITNVLKLTFNESPTAVPSAFPPSPVAMAPAAESYARPQVPDDSNAIPPEVRKETIKEAESESAKGRRQKAGSEEPVLIQEKTVTKRAPSEKASDKEVSRPVPSRDISATPEVQEPATLASGLLQSISLPRAIFDSAPPLLSLPAIVTREIINNIVSGAGPITAPPQVEQYFVESRIKEIAGPEPAVQPTAEVPVQPLSKPERTEKTSAKQAATEAPVKPLARQMPTEKAQAATIVQASDIYNLMVSVANSYIVEAAVPVLPAETVQGTGSADGREAAQPSLATVPALAGTGKVINEIINIANSYDIIDSILPTKSSSRAEVTQYLLAMPGQPASDTQLKVLLDMVATLQSSRAMPAPGSLVPGVQEEKTASDVPGDLREAMANLRATMTALTQTVIGPAVAAPGQERDVMPSAREAPQLFDIETSAAGAGAPDLSANSAMRSDIDVLQGTVGRLQDAIEDIRQTSPGPVDLLALQLPLAMAPGAGSVPAPAVSIEIEGVKTRGPEIRLPDYTPVAQEFLEMHGIIAKLQAPMFAEGGTVTRPTFAFLGEAGPEQIVPSGEWNSAIDTLNKNYQDLWADVKELGQGVQSLADNVASALTSINTGGSGSKGEESSSGGDETPETDLTKAFSLQGFISNPDGFENSPSAEEFGWTAGLGALQYTGSYFFSGATGDGGGGGDSGSGDSGGGSGGSGSSGDEDTVSPFSLQSYFSSADNFENSPSPEKFGLSSGLGAFNYTKDYFFGGDSGGDSKAAAENFDEWAWEKGEEDKEEDDLYELMDMIDFATTIRKKREGDFG